VAADDLSSITGMEDKHRKALARRQITTLRGLADANQDVIYRAMGSIRPRPTFKQVAQWQAEARSRLGEPGGRDEAGGRPEEERGRKEEERGRKEEWSEDGAVVNTTEWRPVASFAVVFAQRRAGDTWERRIEAERTEVEPEREPEVWPGWECNPICGWMLGQLVQADSAEPGGPGQDGGGHAQPAGEPAAAAKPRGVRPQLRIDRATIIDEASRADLVTDGALVANPPCELTAPTRVVFTVTGARRGTEVQVVARLRGRGEPGHNVADPVAIPSSGRAEFDLSQVTADQLELDLLAWAPDATARPASVRLPTMRMAQARSD
jgi:hypothetical protein